MPDYVTKDSGERIQFATGAQRDTDSGKPRYELIPAGPLRRLAELYTRGAAKYGVDNWCNGFDFRRTFGSLLRHAHSWAEGDRTEDHQAAVCFNAMALMFFEDEIAAGRMPASLNNMPGGLCQMYAGNHAPCDAPGDAPLPLEVVRVQCPHCLVWLQASDEACYQCGSRTQEVA